MPQPREHDITPTDFDEVDNYLVGTGRARDRRPRGLTAALWENDRPAVASEGRSSNDDLMLLIGNPANPRLRKEYERATGQDWPRDPKTGRPYDVGHIRALADGGKNELSNIRPIHPDAHRAEHRANGDYSRWGKRAGIAGAFGGKVAPSLGELGVIPNITGILSGRIRMDTFDNFASDMMGMPSRQDRLEAYRRQGREII